MNFYNKKLFLILLCSSVMGLLATIVSGGQKILSEYDGFVLKNKLCQDIIVLLDGKSEWEKEEIIKYLYNETDLVSLPYSIAYSDTSFIDGIKEKIQALSCRSSHEAEKMQQLVSVCLKSLPKRGIKNTWSTIFYCFKLAGEKC